MNSQKDLSQVLPFPEGISMNPNDASPDETIGMSTLTKYLNKL
jgi:hypothetical protein